MASIGQIRGIAKLKERLSNQKGVEIKRITTGLLRAGLQLQALSQAVVPIDTGMLRNSAFTRVEDRGTTQVSVRVGYTAAYAIYVHENLDAQHKPGKQAKFLEGPMRENMHLLKQIFREAIK